MQNNELYINILVNLYYVWVKANLRGKEKVRRIIVQTESRKGN